MKHFVISLFRFVLSITILIFLVIAAYFYIPSKIHYQVTERYIMTAENEDADVFIGVILPKSNSYQAISSINVIWEGSDEIINYKEVAVLKLIGYVNKGEQIEAVISYDVAIRSGIVIWKEPVLELHTLPQLGIQSDHAIIQKAGEEITKKTSLGGIYDIYNFIIKHFSKSNNLEYNLRLSAIEAYLLGKGTCLEQSKLMVALCRSKEFPAQVVIGNIYPELGQENQILSNNYGHAWVEFFAVGFWSMADPYWGNLISPLLHIGRNDGLHLSYGEYIGEYEAYRNIFEWSYSLGKLVKTRNAFMRYSISSSEKISVIPGVIVERGWDGRLMNTLITWIIVTFIFYNNQRKYLLKN